MMGCWRGWRGRCRGGSRLVGLRMSIAPVSVLVGVMGALTRSLGPGPHGCRVDFGAHGGVVHLSRPRSSVDPGGDVVRAVKAAKESGWGRPDEGIVRVVAVWVELE